MSAAPTTDTEAQVRAFLAEHSLASADATLTPLTGGVSSAIWLVADGDATLVVKQPLEQLNVASEWHASMDRSDSEVAYLSVVSGLIPGVCPRVLASDGEAHLLALDYLDPSTHLLWKTELMEGRVDPAVAGAVGDRLGAVHAATAARPELADQFDNDDLFTELRIEPYLQRLVAVHPDLADAIGSVIETTLSTKLALVHGDASPKNILIGPNGPVLLDAETAVWGDPAFDVAFCLNHLLLKGLLPAAPVVALDAATDLFLLGYRPHVTWEAVEALETRVAALLPALLLARVDGRSPVEYLDEAARGHVRDFALSVLRGTPMSLTHLIDSWRNTRS